MNKVNTASSNKSFFRKDTKMPTLGTITGMLINLSDKETDAYIYSNVNETKTHKAILKYKIDDGNWLEKSDAIYPYEFSIPLKSPNQQLTFKWISEEVDGKTYESEEFSLKN